MKIKFSNLLSLISILLSIKAIGQIPQSNMLGVNDQVSCITRYQNIVFISGSFTLVDTTTRVSVAAIDAITGSLLSWYPNPTGGTVGKLIVADNKLFVFGSFTGVSGVSRNRIAIYSLPALTLLNSPSLDTLNPWGTCSLIDNKIYYLRNSGVLSSLRRFDINTLLSDTSWYPVYSNLNSVYSIGLLNNFIYLGGVGLPFIERYDINTAIKDTSYHLNLTSGSFGLSWIYSVLGYNSKLYITGSFDHVNGIARRGIAEITSVGVVTNLDIYCSNIQNYALFPQGNTLWIGGNSYSIGSGTTYRVSQVDINTGYSTCWTTGASSNQGYIRSIFAQNDTVYLGGANFSNLFNPFTVINGNPSYINIGKDTIVCPISTISIQANPLFNTFIWNTGATTSSINVNAPGNYWVTATKTNGCEATDSILVQGCTGLNSYLPDDLLNIFPNPSNGIFTINFEGHSKLGLVEIYNTNGELNLKEQISQWSQYKHLDITNQPNGIYLVRLGWQNKTTIVKVIKE